MRHFAPLLLAVGLVAPTPASALIINLVVNLDAAQAESSAPGASGSGSGTLQLDTVAQTLSYNITWGGTQGTENFTHFHAACGIGDTCPARFFLEPNPPPGGGPTPKVGVLNLSETDDFGNTYVGGIAQEIADIQAGLWYVNVHTTHSVTGEIRGQVLVPEPAAALAVMGMLGLLVAGRGSRER